MLAGVAGIVRALDRAAAMHFGLQFTSGALLVLIAVAGFIGGLISLWGFSLLVRWTGNWLGGKATVEQLHAAYAWSSVPCLVQLPVWGMLIGFIGPRLFRNELTTLAQEPELAAQIFPLTLLTVILGLWSFVLYCHAITEVQGYQSSWKGLLNVVLAASLFLVILFPLAVISGR